MPARYFPIALDVEGRPCVVIGGGHEAEGKVRSLLEAGARVQVVSPDLTPRLLDLFQAGRIAWLRREYRSGDLAGAFLAFACTDDEAVNRAVAAEAATAGVLLNVVDQPAWCHFIMPAVVRRGSLTLAVTTDGKSPALAAAIKAELAAAYGPADAEFVDVMGDLRRRVMAAGLPLARRRELFCRLVACGARERLRAGDRRGMYARLAAVLAEYGVPCPPEWPMEGLDCA